MKALARRTVYTARKNWAMQLHCVPLWSSHSIDFLVVVGHRLRPE